MVKACPDVHPLDPLDRRNSDRRGGIQAGGSVCMGSAVVTMRTVLRAIKGALLLSAGFFAGIAKVSVVPSWWPPNRADFFPWVAGNQFWLLTGPPVVVVFVQWLEKGFDDRAARVRSACLEHERTERLRVLLGALLARMRPEFFPKHLRDESEVHHRLTVFRASADGTRLEIVARSSSATSGSRTTWTIHNDVLDRCEGVAGVAWHLNMLIQVPGKGEAPLPDVSTSPSDDDVREYARRTWVSDAQVRTIRWKARSYAAIVLRSSGRKWGVLVLDSTDPHGTIGTIIKGRLFTADMLGDIIQAWSEP